MPELRLLRIEGTAMTKPTRRHITLARYGLTVADYETLLTLQGGVCRVCGRPPKTRALNIDHEHQRRESKALPESRKGRVRGLLCHRCNRALGLLGNGTEELIDRIDNLKEYLQEYADRKPSAPRARKASE